MIEYQEFSSLAHDLGFSAKALYTVSNHIHAHYHTVSIPKGNGEYRKLSVPDDFLKAIQKKINEKLLFQEAISPYATAYRPGGSTKRNAAPHIGNPTILKLDIRHFFDHLIYPVVKEKAFPAAHYSEANRVLLSLLCIYKDALPQGAPTSPAISNIVMRDFDNTVGSWCSMQSIVYTRYCDDMTFSGDFDPEPVARFAETELRKMGLYLNSRKTVAVRTGQKHIITGIVVNEKLSIPSAYKRRLRQEMFYCMKFGIASHLLQNGIEEDPQIFAVKLLGKINYVLFVEPDNCEMKNYAGWLKKYSG